MEDDLSNGLTQARRLNTEELVSSIKESIEHTADRVISLKKNVESKPFKKGIILSSLNDNIMHSYKCLESASRMLDNTLKDLEEAQYDKILVGDAKTSD